VSVPNVEALRRVAAEVDAMAAEVERRSSASGAAIRELAWSGPRRDAFVLGAAELGTRAAGQAGALRSLAAELRALATAAEERLAALRRIETFVRARIHVLIDEARTILAAAEGQLQLVAAAVAIVPGSHGIEHRLAMARARLERLLSFEQWLPPPLDLRWEDVARQLATGAFG
jgi:hypothetical protein